MPMSGHLDVMDDAHTMAKTTKPARNISIATSPDTADTSKAPMP